MDEQKASKSSGKTKEMSELCADRNRTRNIAFWTKRRTKGMKNEQGETDERKKKEK